MASIYKTFRNWDQIDCEAYWCGANADKRDIDDPELNQDDTSRKSQQEFDDSDDFHKNDDTDDGDVEEDGVSDSGKYDGNISI
ncbi:MAG: hypothetical protein CFE23_13295 [Flavobacterium sp. BFFFF1]|uniref:hypothetical protein n=1 Tax=Flavobacterium sp. BFFFF1 TaxID=2015557 RepID=UPI000BCABCA0|nr:hypothetical protein [Flavobacterium sp. BFFFF1]OYU79560.1 MAG: hypothetical protein CFE23_13295 [Flavobacterium sp. BFFFF1]